jgi:hypothetical protein
MEAILSYLRYLSAAIIFALAFPLNAADVAAAEEFSMHKACNAEITEYCPQVKPGGGRIQSCLYAHTDLLSDACYAATEQGGVILERLFDKLELFYSACAADVRELCKDVQIGQDRVRQCLAQQPEKVSAGCVAAFSSIGRGL